MRVVAGGDGGRSVDAMNATTATQVLGLRDPRPARDELVSAWRRFARTHHPDRCPGDRGAARRFSSGREAFETLLAGAGEEPPAPVLTYRRAGVVRGEPARRALPYEMRPLATRQWRA